MINGHPGPVNDSELLPVKLDKRQGTHSHGNPYIRKYRRSSVISIDTMTVKNDLHMKKTLSPKSFKPNGKYSKKYVEAYTVSDFYYPESTSQSQNQLFPGNNFRCIKRLFSIGLTYEQKVRKDLLSLFHLISRVFSSHTLQDSS